MVAFNLIYETNVALTRRVHVTAVALKAACTSL